MYSAYGYEAAHAMEELGLALIPGLISGIPSGLFSIAAYVLTALGLYTLAKRRGIRNAWLSWVPVLNCWVIGSLSDQYRYVVKGEYKSKRKVLLTLNLINAVITLLILVAIVVAVIGAFSGNYYRMDAEDILEAVMWPLLGVAGLALPLAGVSIAALVFHFMAMYDIYTSMDPGNNVLFLVLSIFFRVTEPFFLFFNREKDNGMPPRRREPVYTVPQPQPEPEEDKDYL